MVVPEGRVRTPSGQPSTISPDALPAAGSAPVMSGAGADGAGKPVGVAVTGGRTSSGLAVEGPEPPPSSFPVPFVSVPPVPVPLPSAPDAVLPDVDVPAPEGVAPWLELEDGGLCAEVAPGFAIWSSTMATAAISTARQIPAMTSRRAIMAYLIRKDRSGERWRRIQEVSQVELTPPTLWWRWPARWRFEAPSCSWGQSAIATRIREQFWLYQRPFRGRGWQTGQV